MEKTSFAQMLKFTLFSISAGIIQAVSFALLNEWLFPRLALFLLALFGKSKPLITLLIQPYWPSYLVALIASVLWNFTFNRRYTFKSAANVPVAMAKVASFYVVFTPLSTWLGQLASNAGINEYIILFVTMACNLVLEFLFCKLVVYRNQENTRQD